MSTEMASLRRPQDRESMLQQWQLYVVLNIYYMPSENVTQVLKDWF